MRICKSYKKIWLNFYLILRIVDFRSKIRRFGYIKIKIFFVLKINFKVN